jgi:hypothetical protein
MEKFRPEILPPKDAFNHFLDGILYRVSKEPRHINREIAGPISKKPITVIANEKAISLNIFLSRYRKMGLFEGNGLMEPELRADYLNGIVSFNLQNHNHQISKEPLVEDFFPGEFKKFVLNKYFLAFGSEIDMCKSHWEPHSDNFTQFAINESNGMSENEAAENTWSGKSFAENGFGRVAQLKKSRTKYGSDIVEVFWQR